MDNILNDLTKEQLIKIIDERIRYQKEIETKIKMSSFSERHPISQPYDFSYPKYCGGI